MSENMVISIIKDAIQTGVLISAPILIVSVLVGLIISIFQATTQIQEQTLTFVPKLIAIAIVGLFTGAWMLHQIVGFTERIFTYIAHITQ
ncbi:flagellar biosynthesis protein FliQ [Clostridium luticellarii]|jgi:flagellar biosynthetic protein FliQ|uniref:Flagellar biosynthetic protein FliQ n=1 Tax=Clostridium luticellarii TaxID=1691940 RepID=A0A2T0BRV5_9CLOT|nr:flagellar biosynthesis protein FliQ [Clostridium luticellarii]MCI1943684.1 flagellar biosynthesis protein FliQ [Clostridium luticellarii]MCI1968935.1 flagellar biosynthesis protein FliQ [Clostridium luticellarii]MCI1994312.1 flagellar biosynthesis protein FliQ [Clostridium luticellarii]MCI2038735.1 flagellar biosynthesis protein FliQ [Clostridium luticellarii]PRR86610.1 Flagellar biosynthetic protein FliQ [Clostridium luticellarii]